MQGAESLLFCGQDELTSCGGLAGLVQVLAASSPRLKLFAANTLKNCAAASARGRQAVENSGAISILVKQLGYPKWYTPGTKRHVQVECLAIHGLALELHFRVY